MDRRLTRRQRINAARAELLHLFDPDVIFHPQRFADICTALKSEVRIAGPAHMIRIISIDEPCVTADAVAVAILAACQETKERAEDVARRVQGMRARYYACLALVENYPEVARPQIARCCGASSSSDASFIGSLEHRLQKQAIRWWSEDSLQRVIAKVKAYANGASPRAALGLPDRHRRVAV